MAWTYRPGSFNKFSWHRRPGGQTWAVVTYAILGQQSQTWMVPGTYSEEDDR